MLSLKYDPTARYDVEASDIEYLRRDGEPLLATVYRPKSSGPVPAILDVHGGAWSGGSRTTSAAFHQDLASTGLVVMAIDFRLAPAHPYPGQVADVNYATRWLKARASDFGGDGSRLGGIGSSSGGHTLMLSAMRPSDPRYCDLPVEGDPDVDASLSYAIVRWAVLDPYVRYTYARDTQRENLVNTALGFFGNEDTLHEANVNEILKGTEEVLLPPVLVIQGTGDDNIPMEIPDEFVKAYRARGGDVQYETYEGMRHSFMSDPSPETDRAVAATKSFIARQLAS
jgi:acetyl esterase/lipase